MLAPQGKGVWTDPGDATLPPDFKIQGEYAAEGWGARVIALGGGAWITAANRDLIEQHHGITVWLDTPFDLCWQRIETSPQDRPLGRTRTQAEQLYHDRRAVYQLAAIHLPVLAHETTAELVARLETALAILQN